MSGKAGRQVGTRYQRVKGRVGRVRAGRQAFDIRGERQVYSVKEWKTFIRFHRVGGWHPISTASSGDRNASRVRMTSRHVISVGQARFQYQGWEAGTHYGRGCGRADYRISGERGRHSIYGW